MPRAIWSGAISFGLVTIPVKLVPAVRESEEVHFHLLHAKDEGRIHNARTCEVDGKEVPWSEIARGYEIERGRYVVVDEAELKRFRPESTQTVEIRQFVDRDGIDPMLFDKPYYLEPQKSGRHAYSLLREALRRSGRVGIADVVIRTRQYPAALRPEGDVLVLELMRYPHEIVAASTLEVPSSKEKTTAGEMNAAMMLIDAMTRELDPRSLRDTYTEELRAFLEARARGEAPKGEPAKPPRATNVIDLVSMLEKSLAQKRTKGARASKPAKASKSAKNGAKGHAQRRAS